MDAIKTNSVKDNNFKYGLFLSSIVVITFVLVFFIAGYKSQAVQTIDINNFEVEENEEALASTNLLQTSNSIDEVKQVPADLNTDNNDSEVKSLNQSKTNSEKVEAIDLVMNPPEGFKRISSFAGDCSELAEGYACINFEDNFVLVVNDKPTVSKEPEEIMGNETIKVFGKHTNFYHILNTDLVKTEELSSNLIKNVNIDIYNKNYKHIEKGTPMSIFPGYLQLSQLSSEPYGGLINNNNRNNFMYSYFMIGNDTDNIISIAVDQKNGFSKIYIDTNNDQDVFNDGAPITVSKNNITCGVKLPLKITGKRNIKGSYNLCMQEVEGNLTYFPMSYYYGNININGSSYKSVAVEQAQFDKNFDGLLYNSGIWIDANQDGRFEEDEHFSDGDILPVDNNTSYKVSLNYP